MVDSSPPEAPPTIEPAPLTDEQFLEALRRVRLRHRLGSISGFALGALLIGLAVEFPAAMTPIVLTGIVAVVLASIGWRYASYVLVPRSESALDTVESVDATVVAVRSIPPAFTADRGGARLEIHRTEVRLAIARAERTLVVADFVRPTRRARLVPGAEVRVRIDPLEPRESVLVWSSLSAERDR